MKKLLLICFILLCQIGQAQTIDGFIMGTDRMAAVRSVPKGFNYDNTNDKNHLRYTRWVYQGGNPSVVDSYDMFFKNNLLCKLEIYRNYYEKNSTSYLDNVLAERFSALLEEFGEPTFANNSYYSWNLPNLKITFRYSAKSEEETEPILNQLYGYRTVTYNRLIININAEMKEGHPQISKPQQGESRYLASGSGFILSKDGIVATNFHVIDGANGIDVFINRNGTIKTYKAKVLISDKTNDISLLKIEDDSFVNFSSIPYAIKTSIQDVGTGVFTLGYPMSNILGEEIKVTDGIISSKTGYKGDIVTYQISAPIQHGNSGGPLFDKQGNIVGITNAGVEDAQNVGNAIKTSYLKNLIDVAPTSITLPTNNSISGLSFTEKIKRLTPYVVLIKIY